MKNSFFKIIAEHFWGSVLVSIGSLAIACWWGWNINGQTGMLQSLWIFLILLILEISLSFDNAVVNASILKNWNKFWQTIFLSLGILIAVFGMRLIFPLIIVGLTTNMSLLETWNLAIEEPAQYSEILLDHHAEISAFGGVFLLLIFLDFFITTKKKIFWLKPFEIRLEKLEKFKGIPILLTLFLLLMLTGTSDLPTSKKSEVVIFGLWGLLSYLSISLLCQSLEQKSTNAVETIKKGSIGGFGSHVLNYIIKNNDNFYKRILIDTIELPDKFIDQDSPENMYRIAKMNSSNIVERVLKKLNIK